MQRKRAVVKDEDALKPFKDTARPGAANKGFISILLPKAVGVAAGVRHVDGKMREGKRWNLQHAGFAV